MKNLSLLREALYYHNKGFSIIPLNGNKAPLVRWRKYQKRAATSRQIKAWFSSLDVQGIGILTGIASGLVVIDVDTRNGGTFSELEKIITPTVKTGSGGRHFYFNPSDADDLETMHFEGYDILGDGAYVVAPPSLHPSGEIYDWMRFVGDTPIQNFPKEFKKALKKTANKVIETTYKAKTPTKVNYKEGEISPVLLRKLRAIPIRQVIEGEGLYIPVAHGGCAHILCPFHNDKNPSMAVYDTSNYAHCYGCHQRFNAIDFIRKYRNLEFREACFYLMEKYDITSD